MDHVLRGRDLHGAAIGLEFSGDALVELLGVYGLISVIVTAIIIGLVIAFAGALVLLAARFFPWFGNLPGDINIERENFNIYFPLATMILISILGTILLNIVIRIFRK